MLVIMKKSASETDLEQTKKFLVEQDYDFHQSTGANRIILGVVGDTSRIDKEALSQQPGVLDIYCIPDED